MNGWLMDRELNLKWQVNGSVPGTTRSPLKRYLGSFVHTGHASRWPLPLALLRVYHVRPIRPVILSGLDRLSASLAFFSAARSRALRHVVILASGSDRSLHLLAATRPLACLCAARRRVHARARRLFRDRAR